MNQKNNKASANNKAKANNKVKNAPKNNSNNGQK